MDDNGTRIEIAAPRQGYWAAFARIAPRAGFLSQLIAEHQRLSPQRARRRAPLAVAVGAYATGARIVEVRLPAGYRTTLEA